jgi:hypothetical protein
MLKKPDTRIRNNPMPAISTIARAAMKVLTYRVLTSRMMTMAAAGNRAHRAPMTPLNIIPASLLDSIVL